MNLSVFRQNWKDVGRNLRTVKACQTDMGHFYIWLVQTMDQGLHPIRLFCGAYRGPFPCQKNILDGNHVRSWFLAWTNGLPLHELLDWFDAIEYLAILWDFCVHAQVLLRSARQVSSFCWGRLRADLMNSYRRFR